MSSFKWILQLDLILLGALAGMTLEYTASCDDYSIKVLSAKPCPGIKSDQIFKFNITSEITMTDQCYVHYSGCMEWDAFEKADVVFGLIRNGRTTVKRKADLCDEKQQSNIFPVVHGFPFPEMCGSPKGAICINDDQPITINLGITPLLALLHGNPQLRFDIFHDQDRRTCYVIVLEFKKQRNLVQRY